MTIVVGVAAPDGIVLAGDSRSTLFAAEHYRVASDNAVKVFSICDRLGVATYGASLIDHKTIAGLMDEFVATLVTQGSLGLANRVTSVLRPPVNLGVTTVARRLAKFFDKRLRRAHPHLPVDEEVLGFLVGGYDSDGIGRIVEVELPSKTIVTAVDTTDRGFVFRGQSDVADRLIFGVDWERLDLDGPLPQATERRLRDLHYDIILPVAMQDAVDFAAFVARTTIDMQRFTDGTRGRRGSVPACGGPIRALAVTRQGTQWIADPALTVEARAGLAEGSS